MIYHLINGDSAASSLKEAVAMEPSMAGEVMVMRDLLNLGPLQKEEGQKFSEMRTAFWQEVTNNDKVPAQVDDMERLLEVVLEMSKNEDVNVWLWMAPWPADLCLFHWSLKYLGKYLGRFFVINIAGLPFLDNNGKIFFPKTLSEIQPKELVKARRLARAVNAAELETDGDEWRKLTVENAAIRTLEGGKRLISRTEDFYDSQLTSFCSHQFQKASRIASQALARYNMPTGDLYLGWRLRKLIDEGKLQVQGEINKTMKDYDVKLPGDGSDAQLNLAV